MQKYESVADLAILIKSRGRHNIEDFTTLKFIREYFPDNRNVAVYTTRDQVQLYKRFLRKQSLQSWSVVGCDIGIFAADKEMLTGTWPFKQVSSGEAEICIYMNDDLFGVNSFQYIEGKKRGVRCDREVLHSTMLEMVSCMQKFNLHLAGFGTTPSPMNVRNGANFTTNMVTVMDPLSLHRRGNMLLYPERAQYKSDWAKSVQNYIHCGANLKAPFILPKFASYSRGGLGPQTPARLRKEEVAEASLEQQYPQYFSSVKEKKNGARSIVWKRKGVRRPRVLFKDGHFVVRSDYDQSDAEDEDGEGGGSEDVLTVRELLLLDGLAGKEDRSTSEILMEMIRLGWDLTMENGVQAGKNLSDIADRAQGSAFTVQNKRRKLGSFWFVEKTANV